MPKLAQGLPAVQVKPVPVGKDSGTRHLRYHSMGRGQRGRDGMGWDGAVARAALGSRTRPQAHPGCDTRLLPTAGQQHSLIPASAMPWGGPISSAAATVAGWHAASPRPRSQTWHLQICESLLWIRSKSSQFSLKVPGKHRKCLHIASKLLFLGSVFHQGTRTSSLGLGILPALLHTLIPLGQAV